MAVNDPIGDLITRIRNAQARNKPKVSTPGSQLRVRDFRGLNPKSFDWRGNYTLGIREHIVFPEIDYDKVTDIWGMDITVCTTARSDDEARALLTAFNFPFRQ